MLIRGCIDRTMEDVYLLLLLVQYQNAKEPVSQLDARVMPHFLSSCIIHTFSRHTLDERVSLLFPFIVVYTITGCTAACWHAAVTASGVAAGS